MEFESYVHARLCEFITIHIHIPKQPSLPILGLAPTKPPNNTLGCKNSLEKRGMET